MDIEEFRKQDKQKDELSSHHCTRENISFTVGFLKDIESGKDDYSLIDWRTTSGVIALQIKWLLRQLDNS